MKRLFGLVFLLCAGMLPAGCGGAGSGTTSAVIPPAAATSPPKATQGDVLFSLSIPSANSIVNAVAKRRPQYVSPNTQSIAVTVNGANRQTIALTPASNPQCSATSTGSTKCTNLSIDAAPGSDTFGFTLYSGAGGAGDLVATYTTQAISIAAGQVNTLGDFTLDAVLASYTISAPWTWIPGQQAYFPLIVTAKDSSGATIIGPGEYVDAGGNPTPITLSLTPGSDGGYNAFSVVTTPLYGSPQTPTVTATLNGPGDTAFLAYNGAAVNAWSLAYGTNTLSLAPQASPIYQSGVIGISSIPSGATGSASTTQTAPATYALAVTLNNCAFLGCSVTVPFAQDGWINVSGTPFVAGAMFFASAPNLNCGPFPLFIQPSTNALTFEAPALPPGTWSCPPLSIIGGEGALANLTLTLQVNP